MSKPTAAELAEELARVDHEIKVVQIELEDAQFINDDFTRKIAAKEKDLVLKDELVKSIRAKNSSELEILQLEYQAVVSKHAHEINFHTAELFSLRTKKNRLNEMKEENEHLKQSVQIFLETINKDNRNHALKLHDMNREMKLLRQQMEEKLRKELTGLEISFQEEAFSALHLKQKKAMLENAKLKDEVTLQGVGIANLTSRLIRQKTQQDKIRKQLQKLHVKSKKLREVLSKATKNRNELIGQKQTLLRQYHELQQSKSLLLYTTMHSSSTSASSVSSSSSSTMTPARGKLHRSQSHCQTKSQKQQQQLITSSSWLNQQNNPILTTILSLPANHNTTLSNQQLQTLATVFTEITMDPDEQFYRQGEGGGGDGEYYDDDYFAQEDNEEDEQSMTSSASIMANSMQQYLSLHEQYMNVFSEYYKWKERLTRMQGLYLELRPIDATEHAGGYDEVYFPVKPVMESILTTDQIETMKGIPESDWAEYLVEQVEQMVQVDNELSKAVKHIVGQGRQVLMPVIQQYLASFATSSGGSTICSASNKCTTTNEEEGEEEEADNEEEEMEDEDEKEEEVEREGDNGNEKEKESQKQEEKRESKYQKQQSKIKDKQEEHENLNGYQNMTAWIALKIISLWKQPIVIPTPPALFPAELPNDRLPRETNADGDNDNDKECLHSPTAKYIVQDYLSQKQQKQGSFKDTEEEEEEGKKEAEWDALMNMNPSQKHHHQQQQMSHTTIESISNVVNDSIPATSWLTRPLAPGLHPLAQDILGALQNSASTPQLITPMNYRPANSSNAAASFCEIGPPLMPSRLMTTSSQQLSASSASLATASTSNFNTISMSASTRSQPSTPANHHLNAVKDPLLMGNKKAHHHRMDNSNNALLNNLKLPHKLMKSMMKTSSLPLLSSTVQSGGVPMLLTAPPSSSTLPEIRKTMSKR